jgi:methyl-CpG-binding domain protein 4
MDNKHERDQLGFEYEVQMKQGWVPPRSPFGLIQEDLWNNEWLILVSCLLLNQTSRKQVERVLPEFINRWKTAESFLDTATDSEVASLCKPLGFSNRRTDLLFKMTRAFLTSEWTHAKELPGIGTYGARAWEIFCCGILGDEAPKDHALVKYFEWAKR